MLTTSLLDNSSARVTSAGVFYVIHLVTLPPQAPASPGRISV